MAADTMNIFNEFTQDLGNEQHDLNATDSIYVALTDSAPAGTEVNFNKTDFPDPTNTNGYSTSPGGQQLDSVTYTESGGTSTFDFADEVFTASGGTLGPFRYCIFYNNSSTSPTNALIGWVDYGSSITLGDGETFTVATTDNGFTIG